jgi:hypothetical protein
MKFGMEIMVLGVINGLLRLESNVTTGCHLINFKKPWLKVELKWVKTVFYVELKEVRSLDNLQLENNA